MLKIGKLYSLNGVTIARLDRGERLRKKNGKKLVRGDGTRYIYIPFDNTKSDWEK